MVIIKDVKLDKNCNVEQQKVLSLMDNANTISFLAQISCPKQVLTANTAQAL
jgi:hypothetical protein